MLGCLAFGAGAGGCSTKSSSSGSSSYISTADLMNPKNCATCHADHFKQWSGSMHAYASDDPVFVAMNARAQRESKGAVGSFCVGCHAPLAVRTGATTDGLNLATLPASLKGVTCFFCHTADKIDGLHNDMVHLAGDDTMRAAISFTLARAEPDA